LVFEKVARPEQMNLKTINIAHIRLISLYWSRYVVRSGSGLVYLMIALVFGLSVAHIIIMPVERLMALQKKQMGQTDPQAINKTIIDIGQSQRGRITSVPPSE